MRRVRIMATALAVAIFIQVAPALASDHLDAPGMTSPGGDSRYDLTDLYVFQSPNDAGSVVLIQAVNPTGAVTDFAPEAVYSFRTALGMIGEASTAESVLDIRTVFTGTGDAQTMFVATSDHNRWFPTYRSIGPVGTENEVAGGGSAQAGVFDDPFFFDLNAFKASREAEPTRAFCDAMTVDFFEGLNVSAIALEVPATWWSSADIAVWATTSVADAQIDRVGRPAIGTVFVPSDFKNAYNEAQPSGDVADFGPAVAAYFGGTIPAGLEVLLPDVLSFNTGMGDGFLNGRHLDDDVIDIELGLITAGAVPGDCVDANDAEFSTSFPYLAAGH